MALHLHCTLAQAGEAVDVCVEGRDQTSQRGQRKHRRRHRRDRQHGMDSIAQRAVSLHCEVIALDIDRHRQGRLVETLEPIQNFYDFHNTLRLWCRFLKNYLLKSFFFTALPT